MEHKNPRFNIYQAGSPMKAAQWVVIEGQRTASGNLEYGAKILTDLMTRDEAIALADKMEREVA